MLELESDATLNGAIVANVFIGKLNHNLITTTIGLGLGVSNSLLQGYNSLVSKSSNCDNERVDFDPNHDFCVGISGSKERTGYGDSGGPIYTQDPYSNQMLLLGIVKGGVKAGNTGNEETEYIRNTSVQAIMTWIEKITNIRKIKNLNLNQ